MLFSDGLLVISLLFEFELIELLIAPVLLVSRTCFSSSVFAVFAVLKYVGISCLSLSLSVITFSGGFFFLTRGILGCTCQGLFVSKLTQALLFSMYRLSWLRRTTTYKCVNARL